MSSNSMRQLTAHDEVILEGVLIELAKEAENSAPLSEADIREAFFREGYIPSTAHNELLGQLLLEGPCQYIGLIVKGLNERCDALISQLRAMEADEEQQTAFSRLQDVLVGRYWLLRLFLKGFPQPPFSIIARVFPVQYEIVLYRWWCPKESRIQIYLCDLILEVAVIEEHLLSPHGALPQNPILRFFARRCRAARRRRFIRAIRRATIAAENLRSFLITYLEPYLLNLHFQREYHDYTDR